MKKCPYCAEEIKDEAVKCRYCHSNLKTEEHRKQDEGRTNPNNEATRLMDSTQSEKKQRWNGFCITAFVLSLLLIPGPVPSSGYSEEFLQLFCGLSIILFVLSITFAGIGLSQVEKNPSMRGKGLGIAAIIISIASAFICILF